MMKKVFWVIYWAIGILFLLWVALSYIDVIVDNCSTNPHHSDFNFFVLLGKKL